MNQLAQLSVSGYRGFRSAGSVRFAQADGGQGSGLTILVGANNSGKSTLIESLRHVDSGTRSFPVDKRNELAGGTIEIKLTDIGGGSRILNTLSGSLTQVDDGLPDRNILVVPSRRSFSPFFGDYGAVDRRGYAIQIDAGSPRSTTIDRFTSRLSRYQRDEVALQKFNSLLGEVLDPVPAWHIDQFTENQYFLSLRWPDAGSHNSDGAGEGVISLFFIIDSLSDAEEGSLIAIDEPELSLHPAVQRKLMGLLERYSAERQIVYTTHSPYFISWDALANGASIARVHSSGAHGTRIAQPSPETLQNVARLRTDTHHPHILGLNANEVFFLDDGIVLLEGQEDVVYFSKIAQELGREIPGTLFGWGAGGEGNMKALLSLFRELAYERVTAIMDNNVADTTRALREEFPTYQILEISAPDIRTKKPVKERAGVTGLLDEKNKIRPEHLEHTRQLYTELEGHQHAR